MFDKIRGFFAGKKTYMGALGAILTAVISWYAGAITPDVAFWTIMGSLGLGGLKMKISEHAGSVGKYMPYLVVVAQIVTAVIKWTADNNTMELVTAVMMALGLTGAGNAVGKTMNATPKA